MTKSLNELAQTAIDALAAINAIQTEWRNSARAGGYAAHFRSSPQIADHLHTELLEVITDFDCDPMGSLEEARFQNEPTERDYKAYIAVTDEQWDYYAAQGVKP